MQRKRILPSILSFVLILTLLAQVIVLPIFAKEQEGAISEGGFSFAIDHTVDFEGKIVDVKGTAGSNNFSTADFDPGIYTDTDETIIQTLASAICARNTAQQIVNYKTNKELKKADILAFYYTAMDTLNSYDYYSVTRCSFNASYYIVNNKDYYFTIIYTLEFYLTPQQEQDVNTKIEEILEQLDVFDKSNLEKLSAAYRYICDTITYNSEAAHRFTTYGALIEQECVCQGYALALMRLLWALDVDIDVAVGIGNGGNHMWNIVKLDGEYFLLDSTWDSGNGIPCYFWFLKGSDDFDDHAPTSPYPAALSNDNHEKAAELSHSWVYDESNQQHYCTACYTRDTVLGHKVVIDKGFAPTCTESGLTDGCHCVLCKSVIDAQQTIPATGHDYFEEITTHASCTDAGAKTYTCSTCSHSYTEAIAATGHSPIIDEAVSPTCTKAGLSEGSHCSVCGAVIRAQETIPATGHAEIIDPAIAANCTDSGVTEGSHCALCGIVLKAQEPVARLGHDYSYTGHSDGTHTGTCNRCEKTVTQEHTFENGLCFCGAKEATLDESISIYHTLDLASDISVTFAVPQTALASYDSYYLECILPEYEGNEQISSSTVRIEPVVSGNYYYFTLTGITAVRMGDMVEATLHMTKNGFKYISKTDSYSVATYAYGMLNSTMDSKMLTLCADLLRYGAEAQRYKAYRTDALVDASMTETHKSHLSNTESLIFTTTDSYLGDVESPFLTWVGKTLDLGSKVGMKFVFNAKNYSGDVASLSMRVSYQSSNGEVKTTTLTGAEAYGSNGTYYSFTFYGLLASELRTVMDVAVYDGDIQLSETLRYSAESYASKNTSGALAPLCKALFAYSDSAKAYFSK